LTLIIVIDRIDSIFAEIDDSNYTEKGEVDESEEDDTSLAVLSG